MTKSSILIVEDEEKILRLLELELEYEGYEVGKAADGLKAFELFQSREWDLILLDIMLPGISGIELLRRIRSQDARTPVILLTAKSSVEDKVSGLDLGANDYITKPFQIEELLARMRAIFRRVESVDQNNHLLLFKDIEMNLEARIVKRETEVIELTKKEFDLLKLLMKNVNRVLTREVLLEAVWGYEAVVETNIVDVYISYLRAKIDRSGQESYIQTVRGSGYVLRK